MLQSQHLIIQKLSQNSVPQSIVRQKIGDAFTQKKSPGQPRTSSAKINTKTIHNFFSRDQNEQNKQTLRFSSEQVYIQTKRVWEDKGIRLRCSRCLSLWSIIIPGAAATPTTTTTNDRRATLSLITVSFSSSRGGFISAVHHGSSSLGKRVAPIVGTPGPVLWTGKVRVGFPFCSVIFDLCNDSGQNCKKIRATQLEKMLALTGKEGKSPCRL